jgi:hypothetical protein
MIYSSLPFTPPALRSGRGSAGRPRTSGASGPRSWQVLHQAPAISEPYHAPPPLSKPAGLCKPSHSGRAHLAFTAPEPSRHRILTAVFGASTIRFTHRNCAPRHVHQETRLAAIGRGISRRPGPRIYRKVIASAVAALETTHVVFARKLPDMVVQLQFEERRKNLSRRDLSVQPLHQLLDVQGFVQP